MGLGRRSWGRASPPPKRSTTTLECVSTHVPIHTCTTLAPGMWGSCRTELFPYRHEGHLLHELGDWIFKSLMKPHDLYNNSRKNCKWRQTELHYEMTFWKICSYSLCYTVAIYTRNCILDSVVKCIYPVKS